MTAQTLPTPADVLALAESVGADGDKWWHNCHAASLAIVRAGIFPGARVARGTCKGVGGQHSWVVVGSPYDREAEIIDPTLWSYDPEVKGVWRGRLVGVGWRHRPHGFGHFFTGGRPSHWGGDTISLTPTTPLSPDALDWLEMIGPLDRRGWAEMTRLPVDGWPAAEIIAAIDDTDALSALVPIDILGMLTDRNPSGLYMRDAAWRPADESARVR